MRNQQIGAALCALATLGLAACGGGCPGGPCGDRHSDPDGDGEREADVRRTQPPAAPKSEVAGAGFDFGTITGLKTVAGVEVMTLDRWTFKGLDDARLAGRACRWHPSRARRSRTRTTG